MDDCSIGYGWDHSVAGHCLAQKEGAVHPSLSWSARKGAGEKVRGRALVSISTTIAYITADGEITDHVPATTL